jgi:hypothetical protein
VPIRPDIGLYAQVLIEVQDFASAATEAAAWLHENEGRVDVLGMSFTWAEREDLPVYGKIQYSEA